jgi:hypothetical protein
MNANEKENNSHDSAGLVNKRVVARAASVSLRSIDNLVARRVILVIRITPRCVRIVARRS